MDVALERTYHNFSLKIYKKTGGVRNILFFFLIKKKKKLLGTPSANGLGSLGAETE